MASAARIEPDELLGRFHAEKEAGAAGGHIISEQGIDLLMCSCGWNSDSPSAYEDWIGHITESGIAIEYP